jgi:hypothetical protein
MTAHLALRLVCLLFLLSGVAHATVFTRFINASTGNDAFNGLTPTTAYRTIQFAVNNPPSNIRNGDTLILDIATGFYNQNVVVPTGWPSQQLSCAVCPGGVKLVLKGPYVTYNGVRFVPTSPVTATNLRDPNVEAEIQQVSGAAGITIGEGVDIEILGLRIRNTNNQAIRYDGDDADQTYTCTVQFPDFVPADPNRRYPSRIRIRHNIIETVGTTFGNTADDGIVGIYNNVDRATGGCQIQRAETFIEDNLVRNVVGNDLATRPLLSAGLVLENVDGTVSIQGNAILGANANRAGLPTMTVGIRLFGVRGTRNNRAIVRKNLVSSTIQSGIQILSDDIVDASNNPIETLTSRWIDVVFNSLAGNNTSEDLNFGGVEVNISSDRADLPNAEINVNNNVFNANNVSGLVYTGDTPFDLRNFRAIHNIFIGNRIGNSPAAGIRNNNADLFAPQISRVDAGGNWWGDERGPHHLAAGGLVPLDSYNSAPGNQELRFENQVQELSIFYSPWLRGNGPNGTQSPDDLLDDATAPFDTASWGFNNTTPKTYIVKELLRILSERDIQPEFHTITPDMNPIPPVSGPGIEGYISKGVALSKDNDTLDVLAGTYQDLITVSKSLTIRGPQANVSASCNSMRDVNVANVNRINREAKIVKGRFLGNPTQNANQPGPLITILNKKATIEGLTFYVFQSQAISNAQERTSQEIIVRNNIIRTMNVPGNGNSVSGPGNIFTGGAFVTFENHNGPLTIEGNKFENIIGRFAYTEQFASSAAISLENCDRSTYVRNNYIEGDPTVIEYDPQSLAPIRLPLSYGVAVIGCRPTGADSLWIEGNYIYRSDNSAIFITDLGVPRRSVNNIVVRRNTIDQANLSTFHEGQNRVVFNNNLLPVPNSVEGGIAMYLSQTGSNNIHVSYNHIKNARNAAVFLRELPQNDPQYAPFNTPSNLKINYNLFHLEQPFTPTTLTVNAHPNFLQYTYANTAADAGLICGWRGTGSVDARANWWNADLGPEHGFNVATAPGRVRLIVEPFNTDKVHYSPWLAGISLPDDQEDRGPVWNPIIASANYYENFAGALTPGVRTNLNMDCASWGYQDNTRKSYYVRISSPGTAACQPQAAHNFAKAGDEVNLRDVRAFEFEDLFITKNLLLNAETDFVNINAKVRDIHVFNGSRVNLVTNFIARNINLSCPVNVNNSCINLGPRVANGFIETYANALFLKELEFEGTVCEQPTTVATEEDRYVRGILVARRRVGPAQANNFGNMGFFLGAGSDNLGNVTVKRIAGPDQSRTLLNPTNPDLSTVVSNNRRSVNRKWTITTENPYTPGSRNVQLFWYQREDNNNSVLLSRPWQWNANKNNAQWTGLQPATVSQIINPRLITAIGFLNDEPVANRRALNDSLTIAENSCNIVAALGTPSSTTICEGQSVDFNLTITGGRAPYTIFVTENGSPLAPITVSGPGTNFTITITPSAIAAQDRIYRIVRINDVTGCSETANLGVQRDILVRPTPTAAISGMPAPVCIGELANFRVDFTGIGPWRFQYRVNPTGPIMEVTTDQNPFTLQVPGPNNSTLNDEMFTVELLSVDYGPNTCNGTVVGSGSVMGTVRPDPTATFVIAQNTSLEACSCAPVQLDVLLTGQGPWIVEYTIGTSRFTTSQLGSTNDPRNGVTRFFTIFPNVINPVQCPQGRFPVRLTRVIDANGCDNLPAGNVDVDIVWKETPNATFTTTTINVCEGTNPVNVPVRVQGDNPWTVRFTVNGVDRFQTIGIGAPSGSIVNLPVTGLLNGANSIIIRGVEDGDGCSNLNINSNAIVNVNPAPSIGFVGVDPEICVGGVGTLTVEVNGVGPWTFGHTQNGIPQPPITVGQFNQRGPAQFNIPVSPSGTTIFALTSVTDGNIPVCAGQVIGNPRIVTVNPLPTASLITPPTTICEGQPVTLQAFVTGRGPWTIGYTANGQGQTPVIVGNSTDPRNGHIVSWTVRPTQTTTYALTTVSDGSSPASTCTNSALGVPTVVTVNPNPTAAFNSPSPVSVCQGNPLRLPIVLTGNGPWFVTYQISGFGPAQTKQISLGLPSQTTGEFVIEETLLGNSQISILSVTDRFGCTSNPSGIGSSVAVIVSAAPSAVLSGGQQIGCLGQPLNLQVTFTGTGPWDLVYRENNNPPQTVAGITTNPYTLVVTPTQLGSVTYRLESVSFSGQCTSTLVSGNATVQVNPLPTATLSTGNTTICSGQQTAIGIVFSGRGPWTVTYRENGGPELTQTLGNATQSGSTPLLWNVTPMMTTTYELVRVQDGNGCVAPAVGTVTITTINAPSVSFVSNSITQCLGQPSNLAVNLVGNGPWNVSFIEGVTPRTVQVGAVGNSGTPAAPFVANIVVNPVITTVYTLTGVTDNSATICPGTVTGGPLTVTVAQPPTANLSVIGGPISVCAGSPVTLLLSATGTITAANPLSVVISDGTTQQTVLMQNPSQQVTVNPTTAGTVTYTIREISYNGNCLITAPSNSITGSATINVQAAPTASISGSPSNVCVGSNISFTVNLSGQPPLAFSYTIVGPSGTPRTFSVNNLQPGPFALTILPQEAGLNTISINSVTGGGTCPGIVVGNPVNFTVGQGPTATISSTGNPAAICLGAPSTLTVNLTGTAPWTITVQEDPAPTTTRTFTGITSSPFTFSVTPNATGTRQFRILSVQDAGGCAPVIGSGVATVNVGNASNITVIAVRNRDVSCNGGADGALTVTAFISPACAPGQCPLEYSLDGVNWQTSNQFTDLPAGTYVAQARIIGTFCAGSSAPVVIRQPSNVSNVRITNVTVNSANVSWAPYDGQGVVFYEVQYRVLGETTWTVASNSIVQNNFNLVGLQNNTTYEVRVRQRCNGSQFSPFVNSSFTTNPLPNCAIPGGIYFSNVMPGMATVNWNPVGQGVCYVVQYRDVANGNWLTEFTQGTSLTLTGLTACNYQVRIRTNCTECSNSSGIRSSFSNAFSLFVPNANCNRAEVAAAPAADLNFRVYPNPNNGTFSVSFNTTSESASSLQLFDLTGKVVFETSYNAVAGENIIPVELNNFAAGVYLLKFNQAGQTQTTKVVLN